MANRKWEYMSLSVENVWLHDGRASDDMNLWAGDGWEVFNILAFDIPNSPKCKSLKIFYRREVTRDVGDVREVD